MKADDPKTMKTDKPKIISSMLILTVSLILLCVFRMEPVLLFAVLYSICFFCLAIGQCIKTKQEKLTTYKSIPNSLFPSLYFEEFLGKSIKITDLEQAILAETKITREKSQGMLISKACLKVVLEYENALRRFLNGLKPKNEKTRKKTLEIIRNRIQLCHKAIETEKTCFVTDNGESASSFNMGRQNEFTNYLLTGVTVPLLIGVINTEATSLQQVWDYIMNHMVVRYTFCVFLVVLSYRTYKYFRNKHSMLSCSRNQIGYEKAELILCAFENAFQNIVDSETAMGRDAISAEETSE